MELADSLIHVGDGCCQVLVANHTGSTQKLPGGSVAGEASEVYQVPAFEPAINMDIDTSDGGGVVTEGTVESGGVIQEGTIDSGGVVQEGRVNGGGEFKQQYDKQVTYTTNPLKTVDWVLVHFPQDETGTARKLSRPWHGPY